MDDLQRAERINEIRHELEARETEDLLEIWQKNDRVEWTPEVFEVIQSILTERNVSLPVQDVNAVSKDKTGPEAELPEEADTYHDSQRLDRISSIARSLSWLAIVLLGLTLIFGVFNVLQLLSTGGSLLSTIVLSLILLAGPILIFGFIWVVLQVIAEGIYLFRDIEENTRKRVDSKGSAGT